MNDKSIERIIVLETKFDNIIDDVAEIKRCVKSLETLANKGSGGLSAILWAGGFVTATIALVATIAGFTWGNK
jgi:hypothetical protein